MKKLLFASVLLLSAISCAYFGVGVLAQEDDQLRMRDPKAVMVSPNLVISQFQTGRSSPSSDDEFVEIHNASSSPVDLNGYRVVYRSAGGSSDVMNPFASWNTSTIIPPGGYYLIAATSYDGPVTPDRTYSTSACSCSMGGNGGGLAIRNGPNDTGAIIDSVGWGTATNIFVEGTVTPAHPVNTSDNAKARADQGCQDTDNNANDFATVSSAPRNSSSPAFTCSGGGTTLFAAMNANPTTVSPAGTTLLTVTVVPATTPPSTNIGVEGNLSSIGGQIVQPFFDNGSNGDVTAGDNVFSYLATIPAGASGGQYSVTAVAHDAQGRSVNTNVSITVNAALPNEDPLIMGNPSQAIASVASEADYLMQKPQYSLSWNRARNIPNWTAWRLDTSWIGSNNNGSWDIDNTLPGGWYRPDPNTDYDEPTYDRGHLCPSGDRTNTAANNDATFVGTNIVPQHPDNNQGPWNEFENYCRTLAGQGNELYIFTGGQGSIGTIGSTQVPANRITIPEVMWKVVIVIPNGSDDLRRVNRTTRTIGIIMPNTPGIRFTPWRNFRVTVDAVEERTGFNFLSHVPRNVQEMIESRLDTQ